VSGSASHGALLVIARLVLKAHEMTDNSTALEAVGFDAAKWLGQWMERSQPALDGHKPADLISTPTGSASVMRLLGSIESGSYQ